MILSLGRRLRSTGHGGQTKLTPSLTPSRPGPCDNIEGWAAVGADGPSLIAQAALASAGKPHLRLILLTT